MSVILCLPNPTLNCYEGMKHTGRLANKVADALANIEADLGWDAQKISMKTTTSQYHRSHNSCITSTVQLNIQRFQSYLMGIVIYKCIYNKRIWMNSNKTIFYAQDESNNLFFVRLFSLVYCPFFWRIHFIIIFSNSIYNCR